MITKEVIEAGITAANKHYLDFMIEDENAFDEAVKAGITAAFAAMPKEDDTQEDDVIALKRLAKLVGMDFVPHKQSQVHTGEAFAAMPGPAVMAKWSGDTSVLPTGALVDIMCFDPTDPNVPARRACWVRHREGRDFPVYRSCDLSDLDELIEGSFDRFLNQAKAAGDPPVGNKDIGERHGDHH